MRRLACLVCLVALGCAPSRARPPDLATPAPVDLALAVDLRSTAARDLPGARSDGNATDCALDSSGKFLDLVDALVTAMRSAANAGSNALAVPSPAERDAFAARVLAVLGGDETQACLLPSSYRLLRIENLRVVAELDGAGRPAPSLMWGSFAAPRALPMPSRRLAVEAPHPIFDANTEHQAADLFQQAGARWFLLAGAHRCADAQPSGCSGTTTACGSDANYRISDAAHAVQLPFFALHALLSQADAQLLFLQLHGNGAACPAALVSDSSGAWSDSGAAGRLAAALVARGVGVGKCGAGYPTASCNLCGTDNVEARLTAGAADACTQLGASYGRLVHVEQQPGLRAAYQPLVDAVLAAFPAS